MKRWTENLSNVVVSLLTAAIIGGAGLVWNGLHNVTRQQAEQSRDLQFVVTSIREIKDAADRDRAALSAYMPRAEADAKLDALRMAASDHARRIERLESGGRR